MRAGGPNAFACGPPDDAHAGIQLFFMRIWTKRETRKVKRFFFHQLTISTSVVPIGVKNTSCAP